MVNCLGTAKEFYLFTDMCKTLQTSPFFILFSLTAISFKIWSVFNLLTSKIIHTHPSEKRLGGFPDRWEATPYPPSFSGPFCRGQTRLFLLCFLLSFLLPFPHSFVCRATFFPQRIPSRYTHLGWPGLTQVASTLVSLFIFFFNWFYLKIFWGFFFNVDHVLQGCFCFMFCFLWPQGLWDLSSPTRDRTHGPMEGKVIFFLNSLLAVLSLCCCTWAFSSGERGLLFVAEHVL